MKNNKKQSPADSEAQRKTRKKTTHKPQPDQENSLTVVGIGASAGGLKALQVFFDTLPDDTGLAFVVITHLHPEHESHLAEILQKNTRMRVRQVTGESHVEQNNVYVIPPNRRIMMTDRTLDVAEFEEPRGMRTPIDLFFRSLAKAHRSMVGIILSGSGTDGAVGIKSIKEESGLLMVQDPGEAEYDGMPRAAIATGIVDVVLPVRELATKLVEYIQHPAVLPSDPEALTVQQVETLQRILAHVEARTGHDFSQYKSTTILRRVQRRMQLTGHETLEAYLAYMRHNFNESAAMFSDILIGVTNFFRDPKVWETVASNVIPALFEDKLEGDTIRVWTIGCSTGEEAYTLGILLLEHMARIEKKFEVQVFASDLDDHALTQAREGIYPAAIEADVSPVRLKQFFNPQDNHYQVRRELREIVLFTNHSVLRDPPFSKLDLISCRNLLIYLNRDMHEDVLDVFHYALNPGGYLFLGGSETADGVKDLFHVVDKSHRIYKAKPWSGEGPHVPALPHRAPRAHNAGVFITPRILQRRFISGMPPLEDQHLKALETFGPPSIWVDEDYVVLNISESAGRYLLQPGGPITSDLLRLVRPELQIELRSALFQAFEKGKTTVSQPVNVTFNGEPHRVIVSVRADKRKTETNREYNRKALVVFLEDESELSIGIHKASQNMAGVQNDELVRQLEEEVQQLRERLQSTIEEYNSSNEEMKAANEELQFINEEYRSTTEELETSKEELQSVNEELQTVNNELRNKLEEVSRAHSDLENLMDATKIATLFLDRDLKIKRYTPGMEELFNIRPTDRGRPITDLTHKLGYLDLVDDARTVLEKLATLERESSSPEGGWLLIRLRPYRTLDDRIEGVVVSFVDISEVKKAERTRKDYESFYTLFHANPIPTMLTRMEDNMVMNVNQAFLDYMDLPREEVIERTAREFNLGLDLKSSDRIGLTTRLLKDGHIRNFEEVIKLPSGDSASVLTSIQYIYIEEKDAIISCFIDITERVRAERQIRQLTLDLTTAEQEERYRISQMLHDDLQQRIFAIKMQLENMQETLNRKNVKIENEEFAKLEEWLTEAITITRQLSTDLSPLSLQGEQLAEVILWLASQMKKQYGLEVKLEVDEVHTSFDNNLQLILFHAIRELLFNVVKHAGVLEAEVGVKKIGKDRIRITVADKGVGFDTGAIMSGSEAAGYGLVTMRQRLELFGCQLDVNSEKDRGTSINIEVPLRGFGSKE